MKIVIVDGHTLNPGDLSWDALKEIGEVTVYGNTPSDLLEERVIDAEVILSNKVVIPNELLLRLNKLKYVGVTATGVNVIDLEQASKQDVTVTNVPGYGTHSVAQHVFALILNFTNNVHASSQNTKKGKWQEVGEWCYWDKPLTELAGKCLGIIGMGAIGQQVAAVGSAFGMKVIYYTPNQKEVDYTYGTLEEIFQQADYLSLNCPLNAQTERIVNREKLKLMKPHAIVINTGRGQLIDEIDLANALKKGTIAGAGLDVLSQEPPTKNELLSLPNCFVTPHQAWATKEARQRLLDMVVDNLKCYLSDKPQNVVSN